MYVIVEIPDHIADDCEVTMTPSIAAPGQWRAHAETADNDHELERGVSVLLGASLSMLRDGVTTTVRRAGGDDS